MTNPKPEQSATAQTKSTVGPALVVYATITMLAIRWTGFAALPYLVIFAPVLTLTALLVLSLVLSALAVALSGAGRR